MPTSIYVVSGGTGASGEQLVRTVLAQFPEARVPVATVSRVRHLAQIRHVVAQAARSGSIVVHTLVDARLRAEMIEQARAQGVVAIDLMGELLNHLSERLRMTPVGQPGLYRSIAWPQLNSPLSTTMASGPRIGRWLKLYWWEYPA